MPNDIVPPADAPVTHRSRVARFRALLQHEGLRSAMRYVADVANHRFTAVYRFDGPTLRNVLLVDRNDPTVERCPDIPVLESYCVFVRDTHNTFRVDASLDDPRVVDHSKRPIVQSYCGYPILDADGSLWGTICHFDYAAIPFDDRESMLLESIAPLVVHAAEHPGELGS